MINAHRWCNAPGDENHWWRDYNKSGGQLLEMSIHQLDIMRWFAGDIKEVYGRYAQRVSKDMPKFTVPDVQVVVLEFASGALGYISTSCALNKGGFAMGFNVILKNMLVEMGLDLKPKVIPEGAADLPPIPESVPGIDQAFIGAIQTGDSSQILCDYREGLKSAAVCIAANQSVASGKPVQPWNG
jgi:predicted dehydrogenase